MIEIYRDRSPVKVGHYKSILEEKGIEIFVRNDALSAMEAPIPVFYPALCVMNDKDHDQAIKILQEIIQKEKANIYSPDITCPNCKEENPATFETCWSCSSDIK